VPFGTCYTYTGRHAGGVSAGHARHGLHVVARFCVYLSRWYPSHLCHRPVVFLRSPFIKHIHHMMTYDLTRMCMHYAVMKTRAMHTNKHTHKLILGRMDVDSAQIGAAETGSVPIQSSDCQNGCGKPPQYRSYCCQSSKLVCLFYTTKLDSSIACSHLWMHACEITRVKLHLCYVYTRSHTLSLSHKITHMCALDCHEDQLTNTSCENQISGRGSMIQYVC